MEKNQTREPIGVGIIGLGRSGYGIHTKVLREIKSTYTIKAVYDPPEPRVKDVASEFLIPHTLHLKSTPKQP